MEEHFSRSNNTNQSRAIYFHHYDENKINMKGFDNIFDCDQQLGIRYN